MTSFNYRLNVHERKINQYYYYYYYYYYFSNFSDLTHPRSRGWVDGWVGVWMAPMHACMHTHTHVHTCKTC